MYRGDHTYWYKGWSDSGGVFSLADTRDSSSCQPEL